MEIQPATLEKTGEAARLAQQLWPGHSLIELEKEMTANILSKESRIFIAFSNHIAVGFAHCQLRHDYVEGTDSSPVGYLEGIFVQEDSRRKGCARQLVQACEEWARSQGCREFASDCELDNLDSQAMHLHLGFQEANRIVCFAKRL